jgi:hypothetical protein
MFFLVSLSSSWLQHANKMDVVKAHGVSRSIHAVVLMLLMYDSLPIISCAEF